MIYLSYYGENPEKHLIFYADNWDSAKSIRDELFGEDATLDEFESVEQAFLGIEFFDTQTKIDCSIECSKCKFYEICGMPKRQKSEMSNEEYVKELEADNVKQAREETAKEILEKLLGFIGYNQQFCIIDDEKVTLLYVDKLFLFVAKLAQEHGVEVEQ